MRLFLLNSVTVSLANGHTLLTSTLTASIDNGKKVENSLIATAPTAGSECSFVNSFKIDRSAVSSNFNVHGVDTGILSCPTSHTCVEDPTSSVGGRCISLFDQGERYDKVYQETAHRSLTSCTFANGTSGQKCVGTQACSDQRYTTVGCGSCNGQAACRYLYKANVAEDSCNGEFACDGLFKVNVAEGSCKGEYSCFKAKGEGSDENEYTNIGEASCVGIESCFFFQGNVGTNSCSGGDLSCFDFRGKVGNNSCYGQKACRFPVAAYLLKGINVGNNSCRGSSSCTFRYQESIGNYSCNGDKACYQKCFTPELYNCYNMWSESFGDNSCNGVQACSYSYATVGDKSCIGSKSCGYSTGVIGDCLCNGDSVCFGLDVARPFDECTPSMSPSEPEKLGSPTTKPNVAQTNVPSKNPVGVAKSAKTPPPSKNVTSKRPVSSKSAKRFL